MPDGTYCDSSAARPPVALTIAGFDPSSGAGITADLQVFAAHGLFGTACITALTVQSTQGVAAVEQVSHLVGPTLEHLNADLPPAGIKIGMLGNAEAVRAVTTYLAGLRARGIDIPVVLDPVLRSSSGKSLLSGRGISLLKEELLPLVDWVTPNFTELEEISGEAMLLPAQEDADVVLHVLHQRYPSLNVVATGGEDPEGCLEANLCVDSLMTMRGELHRFSAERVATTSTHGTGCAFSSALLSRLILGDNPHQAVAAAKSYVTEALKRAPGLGKGKGPLNLLWPLIKRP